MRSKVQKYLSLTIGLLVAASVILSQSFSTPEVTDSDPVKTEQSDAKSTEKGRVTISVTSLPAPTVIHFTQEAFCLFEIFYAEDVTAEKPHRIDDTLTKFFSTLLSVFIAPNAP